MTSPRRQQTCAAQHYGYWSIKPSFLQQMYRDYLSGRLPKIQGYDDDDPETKEHDGRDIIDPAEYYALDYQVYDGVAVMKVRGQITKYGSSFGGASYVALKHSLRKARTQDTNARRALIVLDTPGGTSAGIGEVEEELRICAGEGFEVDAWVDDLCCSAGVRIACHCRRVYCNPTAQVGCVGTYALLTDYSEMDKEMGLRMVLVSSGGVKGMGADGKVTDELEEDVKREVFEVNELFLDALKHRGLSDEEIAEVNDGRTHIAKRALEFKLVDELASLDDTLSQLTERDTTMNEAEFREFAQANPGVLQSVAEPLITAARAEGVTEGEGNTEQAVKQARDDERARQAAMQSAFADHPEFVTEMVASENTVEQAKVIAFDRNLQAKKADAGGEGGEPDKGQNQQQNAQGRVPGTDPADLPDDDNEEPGREATADQPKQSEVDRLLQMSSLGQNALRNRQSVTSN